MRGHIRKRGSTYSVVFDIGRDENGKRRQKWVSGFKTKKEAEKYLAEVINKIEKGTYVDDTEMTLAEYLEYWLGTYAKQNVKESTFVSYATAIRKHIIPRLGNLQLKKLKPFHLQNYYSTLLEEKVLSSTKVLYHHRILHEALKHAVQWHLIEYNPADAVEPPKKNKYNAQIWDDKTAKEAIEKLKDSKVYIPVLLSLTTGMRLGEIAALTWDNVDFQNKVIYVDKTVIRINGKVSISDVKTEKSRRSIAISDFVIQELKKHLKKQKENKLKYGTNYVDTNFVCTHEDGRQQLPDYITKKFQKEIQKYGLPKVRFHDLRHTHASLLLKQGINPKVVSERLGHSSISITMDLYSHVVPELQREAARKIEELIK